MAELRARPVSGDDAGLQQALLAADLPIDDLAEAGRQFFRFEDAGGPVGYAGLEPLGRYALIRSIVVVPEARGRGFGRAIAAAVMGEAQRAGAEEAFLLTTDAGPFFEHLGFVPRERATAPGEVLSTRQASTICASAALLSRPIADA